MTNQEDRREGIKEKLRGKALVSMVMEDVHEKNWIAAHLCWSFVLLANSSQCM